MRDLLGSFAVLVVIMLLFFGVNQLQFGGDHPGESAPSYEPDVAAVRWDRTDVQCSDGWRSPSIGKRGACSHHGGVVVIYEGSNGQVLECGGDNLPPSSARAQRSQERFEGWNGRYWCE